MASDELTMTELTEFFDVSNNTIGRWRDNGLIPNPITRHGRCVFICMDPWLTSCTYNAWPHQVPTVADLKNGTTRLLRASDATRIINDKRLRHTIPEGSYLKTRHIECCWPYMQIGTGHAVRFFASHIERVAKPDGWPEFSFSAEQLTWVLGIDINTQLPKGCGLALCRVGDGLGCTVRSVIKFLQRFPPKNQTWQEWLSQTKRDATPLVLVGKEQIVSANNRGAPYLEIPMPNGKLYYMQQKRTSRALPLL